MCVNDACNLTGDNRNHFEGEGVHMDLLYHGGQQNVYFQGKGNKIVSKGSNVRLRYIFFSERREGRGGGCSSGLFRFFQVALEITPHSKP